MSALDIAQQTDANQRKASDPNASAWVSANAGAGKTTVLVNRVLRLLLQGPSPSGEPGQGTPPERILCLTYTKTAAAEMENRLFKALAGWTALDDEALAERLTRLTGHAPDAAMLARARRLFARTLEAKGGLKIHTIHAFCERLLHRFPLEAGVPPDFQVLDDRERQSLRDAALYAVLDRAARDPGGRLGDALAHVIAATGEDRFRDCIDAVLARQEELRGILADSADADRFAEGEELALRRLLGVRPGATEESLHEAQAGVFGEAILNRAIAALNESDKKTDKDLAGNLVSASQASSREQKISAFRSAFLKQDGEPKSASRLFTNTVRNGHPDIAQLLLETQSQFYELTVELLALRIAGASGAILALADAILGDYERRKAARAGLDYDDLILKTVSLLRTSDAAAWVLYKLDGGIDHILVDEAQDTSPTQWQVVTTLVEEFFSGEGAREAVRTIFAVGDEKQSIYSFQGAAPAAFARQGRAFASRAAAIGHTLHAVPLNLSFRSTSAVLSSVDAVFSKPEAMAGLTWEETAILHHAFRTGQAGTVEIWPVEKPLERGEAEAFAPLDDESEGREAVDRVVGAVAAMVAGWLELGTLLESHGRPITPSDILILVSKREPFVRPMIKALKDRNIPVAGADRMRLTEQLAVLDLLALGDTLLMPEDDLSLATLLKSPLFGFDDDDLFDLAYARGGSLWRALREKEGEKYERAVERLETWLARADFQPPYEFFAGVLEEHQMLMRRQMLARLGPDAGDALDEFLNLALAYDEMEAPSLQGFLHFVRSGEAEVKRDMEQGRDEVRIMTVHGAKGLEANIVIVPDTCAAPKNAARAPVIPVPRRNQPPGAAPHLVWALPGASQLAPIAEARQTLAQAEREEYNRLLYVAMTRARDRLYVCGWENRNGRGAGSWYDHVAEGMKPLVEERVDETGRVIWRHEEAQAEPAQPQAVPELPLALALPDWATRPAPAEAPSRVPLAPSAIVPFAAAESSGEQDVASPLQLADRSRFLRGTVVHALLQHLPGLDPVRWEEVALAFAARYGDELAPEARREIVTETLSILRHPELSDLFGPGSRTEVPIVARLQPRPDSPPMEISGQVDRLAELDNAVLIVDYKTNRPPPQTPEEVAPAYIAQLAAYRAALRGLFPAKPVRCVLLWTAAPRIMELPEALLDAAEARLLEGRPATLDASRPYT